MRTNHNDVNLYIKEHVLDLCTCNCLDRNKFKYCVSNYSDDRRINVCTFLRYLLGKR